MAEYKLKELADFLNVTLDELLEFVNVTVWSQCEATKQVGGGAYIRCLFQADHGVEPHSWESTVVLQREKERDEARREAERYRKSPLADLAARLRGKYGVEILESDLSAAIYAVLTRSN